MVLLHAEIGNAKHESTLAPRKNPSLEGIGLRVGQSAEGVLEDNASKAVGKEDQGLGIAEGAPVCSDLRDEAD
jgi:hypothetical protein